MCRTSSVASGGLSRSGSTRSGEERGAACCITAGRRHLEPRHDSSLPGGSLTAAAPWFPGVCRGREKVRLTDFETGVKYMEFTEAVARSCQSGQAVSLPLLG